MSEDLVVVVKKVIFDAVIAYFSHHRVEVEMPKVVLPKNQI